jgi:hypothetical protein
LICEDNLIIVGSTFFLPVRCRLRQTAVRDMGLQGSHPWGKPVLLSSSPVIGWECIGGNESLDAVLEACGGCDYSAVANVLAWSTWDDLCETFWLGMDLGRRRARLWLVECLVGSVQWSVIAAEEGIVSG